MTSLLFLATLATCGALAFAIIVSEISLAKQEARNDEEL